MIRCQHRHVAWAAALILLACHSAGAAARDDGCIHSPETSISVPIDIYPVFSQGRAVTVRTTLDAFASRTECADLSYVNLRLRGRDPEVARLLICTSDARVRQAGRIHYAYLQGPFPCMSLPEEGYVYPVLPPVDPYGDDDYGPPFDSSEALEIEFTPAHWTLGPASPAPGGTVFAPSTPSFTIALPARSDREIAIEYRHEALDHYFLTADPGEAAYLDSLGTNGGWRRTGLTFPVRGTTRVCRFYGSVSPGPNAHFYALEGDTCDFLRRLQDATPADRPRWNFEAYAFFATPPDIDGRCPLATKSVYRAYNNGFARGIDSNHRYATDPGTFDDDLRRGWKLEGVAFCVPS